MSTLLAEASRNPAALRRDSALIRVGLPLPAGKLVEAARDADIPVLFSSNAFMIRDKETGQIQRVRTPAPGCYGNLNAALDSAGFVAAAKYRSYPWSIEQYLDLAESYDWAWYSSMDLCVEPEVAGSSFDVMFRVAETCRLYGELKRSAQDRGMAKLPIPILQGWTPAQYLWCFDHYPTFEWPDLIGIGSMCRRHIHGEVGVLSVIDALDRVLPANVKFHLFGVKGKALETLGKHPRLASVDSMAWDFAARRDHPIGRDTTLRTRYMMDWLAKNTEVAASAQPSYTPSLIDVEPESVPPAVDSWLQLVASGEIEASCAQSHAERDLLHAAPDGRYAAPEDDEEEGEFDSMRM